MLQLSPFIWSLTVASAVYSDNGVYSCNVTNNFVYDFVSLNVFVGGKEREKEGGDMHGSVRGCLSHTLTVVSN